MANEKRLIDANALKREFSTIADMSNLDYIFIDVISDAIEDAPTVDAEPVVHGRWVARKICGGSTIFKCSECSREVEVTNDYFGKPSNHVAKHYPYCHCGAKMDGERKDNEN